MKLIPKSYFCKKSVLKKILIIRFSSIGDIVLTTPVIRCVKQQVPDAEVHFAVKKSFYAVVKANPFIDKIHVLEDDLKAFTRELKDEKFDFIVDLHRSLRSNYIRASLLRPSATFPKLNMRKWFLVRFKLNLMPDIHIVDRYFVAVRQLGVVNDENGLDYFIPEDEEFDVQSLPEGFRAGYVALVVGAKHVTKRMPVHKLVDVCKQLNSPVILLGGKEDALIADEVVAGTGPQVLSMCGKLSLNRSASLVWQSASVITHDTGLMHIAAAFRKKIVSVWGNTVPELGMYPYLPGEEEKSVVIEVKGLTCRPCSKLGYERCPKGHFKCMELIDAAEVAGKSR